MKDVFVWSSAPHKQEFCSHSYVYKALICCCRKYQNHDFNEVIAVSSLKILLANENNGNDTEGDKIDLGVQPHAEFINALGSIRTIGYLQTFQDHVEDDDQCADDEGADEDCIQKGHVPQSWQVIRDCEIEGHKYQQVTAGGFNSFSTTLTPMVSW